MIKYKIYQNGIFIKEVTGTSATITDLTPNTKYVFEVSETDGTDESAKSQSVEVVTGSIPVDSITLNATSKTLKKGETFQLVATVLPATASDKTVTYTYSDGTVANVTAEGLVTAIAAGTCTVTAKTANGKSATCEITVTPATVVPTNLTATEITTTSCKLTWQKGE